VLVAAIVGIALAGGSGGGGSDSAKSAATATPSGAAAKSTAVLADQGCSKEKSLSSSADATTKSQIVFENKTADRVTTYWLDENGKRTSYGSLGPGESGKQGTYATQPWVVANSGGKCLGIYAAADKPGRAVVAPVAPLEDQGCAQEKSVRPGGDDAAKSKVVFQNETTNPVQIFWVNSAGKREPYGTLEPGQSQNQQTYDADPWVVADTEGKCVAVYVAGPEPAHAIISGT
jgi:hypothetical protein